MTGVLAVTAGTAALPAITPSGDPNTGIFSPGPGQLAISTNGTGRLLISSAGNATFTGNGTARQTADFTNTGGQLYVGVESSAGGAVFTGAAAYAGIIGTNNSTPLNFATNGSLRATLDTSGRLGLGTSSPDSGSMMTVFNATTASYRAQNNVGGAAVFGVSDSVASEGFINASNAWRLNVDGTTRASLTSTGLGIGTTSPTALLDVGTDTVRVRTARTPSSATATGNAGDICWDANYVYVCTATNTWKRSALSTW
jgi:hypothetical protein